MISNIRWKKNGAKDISNVFDAVDVMPNYNGSIKKYRKYIAANLIYPEDAANRGIQGIVYVSFIVMEDGKVSGVKIERGINQALNAETIRVVQDTPELWTPGLIDNKPVRVHFLLPVNFSFR